MSNPKPPSRPATAGKQTRPAVSTLAANVLAGRVKPTPAQVKTLAGAALSNDETKGQGRR